MVPLYTGLVVRGIAGYELIIAAAASGKIVSLKSRANAQSRGIVALSYSASPRVLVQNFPWFLVFVECCGGEHTTGTNGSSSPLLGRRNIDPRGRWGPVIWRPLPPPRLRPSQPPLEFKNAQHPKPNAQRTTRFIQLGDGH